MTKTRLALAVGLCVVLAIAASWGKICDAFGPMKLHESQCLICHRERVEKWVCGSKVTDEISINQYSNWIDTFVSTNHAHVWRPHTLYYRSQWFGGTSIGCGGIATIPRIFEQRETLGELQSQKLVAKFHDLINAMQPRFSWGELKAFTKTVVDDPQSLLRASDEK
jgi:hypothetical protein